MLQRIGSFARRLLRFALFAVLLLAVLAEVAWLGRRAWLEPIVRRQAESVLGDALGARVRIGELGGSWATGLETTLDIERPEDERAVLQRVEGAEITAAYDPLALARQDWSGLTGLRVHADLVEIRLPPLEGGAEPGEPAALDSFDTSRIEPFLEAFPADARVEIERLLVESAEGDIVHDGPARLEVEQGRAVRVALVHARGDLEILAHADPQIVARVGATLDDPGALLRTLGVDNDLRGGELRVLARVDPGAPIAAGRVSWTGGGYADRGPASVRAEIVAVPSAVRGSVQVEAPGIVVEGSALRVPLPSPTLDAARGAVTIDVQDTSAFEGLLPAEVQDLLPFTGRLRAELAGDAVRVGRGRLVGADWSVALSGGEIPLRGGSGRLSFVAELAEPRRFALGPNAALVAVGRVDGTITGSLEEPRVRGRAELGPGEVTGAVAWTAVSADVEFAENTIRSPDAEVLGLRPAAEPPELGARFDGRFAVALPEPDRPLTVEAAGAVDIASLELVAADPSFAAVSPGTVELDGRVSIPRGVLPYGSLELAFDELRANAERAPAAGRLMARIAPEDGRRTFDVTFDGRLDPLLLRLAGIDDALLERVVGADVTLSAEGSVPVDLSALPAATIELDVAELVAGDAPPATVRVRARLDPDDAVIDLESLLVQGPVEAEASGVVPLRRDARIDLRVSVDAEDLTPVALFVPQVPPTGQLAIDARATGRLMEPDVEARLSVSLPNLASVGLQWPETLGAEPAGSVRLTFDGRMEQGALSIGAADFAIGPPDAPDVSLQLEGSPPLALDEGRIVDTSPDDPLVGTLRVQRRLGALGEVDVNAGLHWTSDALRLDDLRIATPHGSAAGTASLVELSRRLAAGSVADTELSGRLELDELDLSAWPATWARSMALAGRVTGNVAVSGTVGAPRPEGRVVVEGGEIKLAPATPTMSEIEATILLAEEAVTLEQLRGRLGVGEIRLTGSLTSPSGALLEDLEQARVRVDLVADDALLLRSTGVKLRASSEIVAEGTLQDLEVRGDVEIGYGKIIRRISLVPELGRRGGMGVDQGLTLFEIPPPLGRAIKFDVAVRTLEPIELVTHVVNAPIEVALNLRGTGAAPQLDGAVSATSGTLRMPAITFAIQQALLTFRPQSTRFPDLRLVATARRHSIDLTATATGKIDSVEILLSSIPPLTQSELFVLASTGQLPDRLREQGIAGQATLVGGYLATEIFDYYFGSDSTEAGASFIDRFHFYSGREIGKNGAESLTVDFDITDRFGLQAERDIYDDYNMGVVYRIRF